MTAGIYIPSAATPTTKLCFYFAIPPFAAAPTLRTLDVPQSAPQCRLAPAGYAGTALQLSPESKKRRALPQSPLLTTRFLRYSAWVYSLGGVRCKMENPTRRSAGKCDGVISDLPFFARGCDCGNAASERGKPPTSLKIRAHMSDHTSVFKIGTLIRNSGNSTLTSVFVTRFLKESYGVKSNLTKEIGFAGPIPSGAAFPTHAKAPSFHEL